MKRTKKKCQMLLAGLLTLMMVFTMWSPSMVYADETVITNDENGIPDMKLYNAILSSLDKSEGETFTVSEAESVEIVIISFVGENSAHSMNLSGIDKLKNLRYLAIYNEFGEGSSIRLSEVEGLSKLGELETFNLYDSYDNSIEVIRALPENLEILRLVGSPATDYGGLSRLTNLKTLSLIADEIDEFSDISMLSELINLEGLFLDQNEISDISILSGLTNLNYLSLDRNKVSDISALSGLMNLKELKLSYNCITDFSPIKALEEKGTCEIYKTPQKVSVTGLAVVGGSEIPVTMKVIDDVYSSLSSAQQTAIDKVLNADSQEDIQKELIKDTAGVSVSTVKYYKLLDVSLPSGTDISAGAVITLKDDSVKAGMNIIMLHLKADGTWENIPVTVADGEIKGTFTSLSPVYYFVVEGSTDSGSGENTGSVSVSTKYEPADITFTGSNGKAMRWISSEKDGNISISGLQTVIADGAKFYAEKVKSTAIANAVAEAKGDVPYVAYDFTLTVDGEEVTTFAEHVDVSMPVPDGFDLGEGQTVTVYYYNNGKLEKCNTAVSDGFVTFGTTHFSTFVYVQESAASAASTPAVSYTVSPKTGENDMVFYMAVLAVAVGGMVYCLNKRRSY